MRILVVTNMFPSRVDESAGIFVARQVEAMRGIHPDWEIEVLHVDTVSRTSRYLSGRSRFREEARRFRPDLVHVHYGLTHIVTSGWSGPLVSTLHGTDVTVFWKRQFTKFFARGSRFLIFVREGMREILGSRLPSATIPCGVDVLSFYPRDRDEARAAMLLPREATLVGFAANPSRPEKNFALFEQIISELNRSGPRVEPVVIANRDPSDMPHLLSALDVLALTSTVEGSPVVTKEALCCGTRVVATNVGDIEVQLRGMGGTSVLSEATPIAGAAAVRRVLAAAAPDHRIAHQRFSTEHEAAAVSAVYSGVLGENNA